MAGLAQDASAATKSAQDSELLALQQQVNRLKNDLTPGQTGQQKLRKACTDFEAVFMSKMWEQMRATIPKGGMLHSPQEDMYRSMFDRDFSEKLANDGGIGLGDMLYKQLKDKIKNTTKIPGKTGLGTIESSTDGKAVTTGTTEGLFTQGSTLKPSGTKEISVGDIGPKRYSAPSRPMGSSSQSSSGGTSASSTGTGLTSAAPVPPASVSGDVMADVEALARRIESDYDHRLAVDGIKPDQASAAAAGTGLSQTTGYGAAGYSGYGTSGAGATAQGQISGYGKAKSAGTGRKLAQIG